MYKKRSSASIVNREMQIKTTVKVSLHTCCNGHHEKTRDGYMYAWLNLFAVHAKLSQHCQLAVFQNKIKILKKRQ